MGLPKIPDAKEIAAMTEEAMRPMANDIAAIKNSLDRLVELQEQTIRLLGGNVPKAKKIA